MMGRPDGLLAMPIPINTVRPYVTPENNVLNDPRMQSVTEKIVSILIDRRSMVIINNYTNGFYPLQRNLPNARRDQLHDKLSQLLTELVTVVRQLGCIDHI